jgi:hypothetical protein
MPRETHLYLYQNCWVYYLCLYCVDVIGEMENRHPYLVVRGWNKEWNDLMNMEVMLKKHFEAEANGAEVASVTIEGTEAQIIFYNSQGNL